MTLIVGPKTSAIMQREIFSRNFHLHHTSSIVMLKSQTTTFNATTKMTSVPLSRIRPPPASLQLYVSRQLTRRHLHFSRALLKAKDRKDGPSDPNKPIVLEQPDKFRPPSHPARIRSRRPRMYYGKDLTEDDKHELESKNYPYMFPAKNTMMNKFLTSRYIHALIALVR